MKRLIAIYMLFVAGTSLLGAQPRVLGLEDCLRAALEAGPQAIIAETDADKSRINLRQSVSELLPSLNLYVNQYYNWGRSVDMQELVIVKNRLTRQTSGSVGASFSLFDGFARLNTVRMNRQLVLEADSKAAGALLRLKAEVSKAYLACILAMLEGRRLQDSYESFGRQLERLRIEAEAGTRKKSDICELEAKRANILSQIAASEAEETTQMSRLRQLTGIGEPFVPDTAAAPLAALEPDGSLEPLSQYAHLMPDVAAARSSLKAAEFALKAAKGGLLPTIGLTAAYGTYYSDAAMAGFKDQLDGNRNPSISLSIAVPLFNAGKASAAVARARADLRASEARLQQAESEALSDILEAERQGACLGEQLKAAEAAARMSRLRQKYATAEYENGAITTSEWTDACQDRAQSECELVQASCKYLFQLKIMEFFKDGIEAEKE